LVNTFLSSFFLRRLKCFALSGKAAIGATALDIAREHQARDEEEWGRIILTVAALSIVITAPVGAVLIALTGPKLLDKSN